MKVKNYVDEFYYLISFIYYIICLALAVVVLLLHVKASYTIISMGVIVLTSTILYLFLGKKYEIHDKYLIIQSGFFKKKIRYSEIKKCFITRNSTLSYATSLKRIALKLKNKVVYISPQNMDGVLRTIINGRTKKC